MLRFSVLAVLGCLAVALCQAKCPTTNPYRSDQEFDMPRFSGNWVVTHKLGDDGGSGYCQCNTVNVTVPHGTVKSKCYDLWFKQYEYSKAFVTEFNKNGKFYGAIIDSAAKLHFVQFNLLATDYDNYAVLYSCDDNGESTKILSRDEPTNDAMDKAVVKALMKHGVDPNKFSPVNRDCKN